MLGDGLGCEAWPQRELLVFDGFQPCQFSREASGGMVVADEFWLGFSS